MKEIKNLNNHYRKSDLSTDSDMSLSVETSSWINADKGYVTSDAVAIVMKDESQDDDYNEDLPVVMLSKENVLELISALAKAATKLRTREEIYEENCKLGYIQKFG